MKCMLSLASILAVLLAVSLGQTAPAIGLDPTSSLTSLSQSGPNQPVLDSLWTPLGPNNASIFTIARDPHNDNKILIGTYFGGLYCTENRGIKWTHLTSPFSTSSVFAVAFDSNNPGTIFAGTFGSGIFKSVDHGETWTAQNDGLTNPSIAALGIDPFDSNVILAATNTGAFRSHDGGNTWFDSNDGLNLNARSLAFDANQPGVVYLGTLGGGTYHSTDGGLTWELFNEGLGETDVSSLDFDNSGANLYASTNSGIFRLSQGASAWEDFTYDLPPTPVNQVVEHPLDGRLFAATEVGVFTLDSAGDAQTWEKWAEIPSRLVLIDPAGDLTYVAATYARFLATTDDGQTFFRIDQGIQNLFVGALAGVATHGVSVMYAGSDRGIRLTSDFFRSDNSPHWVGGDGFNHGVFGLATHPTEPNILFAGTEHAGVWKSTDWGITWEQTSNGIVPTQIFAISQSPVGNNTLYAGTNAGLYISRDDGLIWQTAETNSAISTQILEVLADPVLPGVAYFSLADGTVYKTIDDGRSFQSISLGLPGNAIVDLASASFGNLYAVTSTGDLYVSFNGGVEWFPAASEIDEPIICVATDPELPWKAYVGTCEGGVYRTTSNSFTWEPINDGLTVPYIFSLAVDRADSDVVYAGTLDTIFKSNDSGETWAERGVGLPEGFVYEIEVDPHDSNVVYVSMANTGIYKTTDGGLTWAESVSGEPFIDNVPITVSQLTLGKLFVGSVIKGVFASTDAGQTYKPANKGMTLFVRGVAISPENPDILFAGSLVGGIFRSTDGGLTWTNKGLGDRNIFNVLVDPLDSSNVCAATSQGVVRSTDSGETWVELGQRTAFIFSLVVDPADREVVYIGSLAGNVFKSEEGGLTWIRANHGLPLANIIALDIDPNGGILYASAEREGVYKSTDNGRTWQATNTDPIGPLQVVSLTVDPATGNVYGAANDGGLYRTTDGGDTWKVINTGFAGDVAAKVVVDPFDGTLYAAALNQARNFAGVSRSTDGGDTWTTSSTGLTTESVMWIIADPQTAGVLYAATDAGVFKSVDSAATWELANVGLEGVNVDTLLIDPLDGAIYVGTCGDGVYKSIDSAATWVRTDIKVEGLKVLSLGYGASVGTIFAGSLEHGFFWTSDRGNTWLGGVRQEFAEPITTFIAINPQDPDVLYAAVSGAGLLKTTDGGVTWNTIGEQIDNPFILAIAVDPVEPDTVYVGTCGAGVYVTEDGGDTWRPLNDGLFNTNVTSLAIDSVNHWIVYAGTEGGGVFRTDRTLPPLDSDGDGVPDEEDCAPFDPLIASAHTFYNDFDQDHFGNPEMAVESCSLVPEPPLVSWANDPWDFDPYTFPLIMPKENRLFGVDFSFLAEDDDFPEDLVIELGMDATTMELLWGDLETSPGAFNGPQVAALLAANTTYAANDLRINLTISPISSIFLTMPDDLKSGITNQTVRFNDPAVIDRFNNLLTFVHDQLKDVELVSLQIGHQIDLFTRETIDISFWEDYTEFYQAAYDHAKSLWGEDLKIGATWTTDGLLNPDLEPLRQMLNSVSDIVSLTYFPRHENFTVIEPTGIVEQLEELVEVAFPKKIYFQTVGYPTAPITRSSITKQSQFFKAFFDFWDQSFTSVPFVSFGQLHDVPRSEAEALADTALYSDIGPGLRPVLVGYLESLGLRTYQGAGEPKTGYRTLRNLTFDHGWWCDYEQATRSFYMGFTTSPYDLPPDGETQVEVATWVRKHIQDNGDIVALHFDGGIPWVEAYEDKFESEELPYSDSLKGTFLQSKNNLPEGHRLLVSINPLGIPRDLLAPYWGYGEGYDYTEDFERIPNGTFADDMNRFPPAPWDAFDFDDESVKIAFLNYAKRVLQYFQPDYLLIGIEVSATLIEDPARYEKFLKLHKFVYESLKASPQYSHVPVMVSFSATTYMIDEYGVAYKFDEQEPGVRDRVMEEFGKFLPYTDIIGLSLYPHYGKYNAYSTPAIIYDELFDMFERFGAANKPIAITESGYAADPYDLFGIPFTGSIDKQDRFYKLLFRELNRHSNPVEFVVSFQIRDGDIGWQRQLDWSLQDPPAVNPTFVEFYKYFRDIGIYDGDGNLRPSGETWLNQLNLPRVPRIAADDQITIHSPNGQLTTAFDVGLTHNLFYTLHLGNKTVLAASPLGIIVDGINLGERVTMITCSDPVTVQEIYDTIGVHSTATSEYNEVMLTVTRDGPGDQTYEIELRLYNDGLAYRYVVPGDCQRQIKGEASGWALPGGCRTWYQDDTATYENEYTSGLVGKVESHIGGPITVELPDGGYLVLTEAALDDYSGMTFFADDTAARTISARFLDDSAWIIDSGSASPWRVTLVNSHLNGLVNSDVITSLNKPPDPGLFPNGPKTDWIQPGRAVWSFWSDNESGFDLNIQKEYVDYAAELGFKYSVVDIGWEVGFPFFGFFDQFEALTDLVNYAHSDGRDVEIIVWKPFVEILDAATRQAFFQALKQAGAAGVKIDFLLNESQVVNGFIEEALQDAAAYELLVSFNNVPKPTGEFRTYPNEITREAVRGLEWNKLADDVTPEYNATLPFTRLIAGPAAYNPVTFDPAELGDTTFAHQLATAGIFTSPLQTWAANPPNILAQTDGLDVIRVMPTVWDETIVLPCSKIGKLAAFARRHGDRWFLFVLNGDSAKGKSIDNVDLSFLGNGRYDAVFLSDDTKTSFARGEAADIDRDFELDVTMLRGGGFVGMFTPPAQQGSSFQMDSTPLPEPRDSQADRSGASLILKEAVMDADDLDNDGVPNEQDCAPTDDRLSSPHVYYFDMDGDQFGDPNNHVSMCSTTPFAGTVPWGNDPDDQDNEMIALIVQKGDRLLGVDFLEPPSSEELRADLARELGAEAVTFQLLWSLLETTPGSFDGPQSSLLQIINFVCAEKGFKLNLTISPITQTYLSLPDDLATSLADGTIRLSDPEVIDRFKDLLDFIYGRVSNVELISLQIGHEIDLFFDVESDIQFWTDFSLFFQEAIDHAKALWSPDLRVGITSTHAGLVNEPTRPLMEVLNGLCDIVSVTYLPRNEDFTVIDPWQVETDIQQLLALYFPKLISFQSVAYPSSPMARSSQTKQSQFLYAFFDTWDKYPEMIPFVSFARLHDYSHERAGTEAQSPHYRVTQESLATATAYLESLGMRTYDESGEHKSAYQTLRNLAFERGWWHVESQESRSFLMGFAPTLYDHNPGGPILDEVLDKIFDVVGSHADLLSYHFDKGVPWVEAFEDTFESDDLPYSDNVKEVWAKHRNRQPAGMKVAVSINPLGIPRERLAAYWGEGEGYYLDENFEPVRTGVIQDYEDRLLPSPWAQYDFDADEVKTAFLNYARRAIEYFNPDYLIMGLEVNLALQADPEAFAKYLELHRYAYEQIRANPAYDDVKIAVSFAAEYFMADELGVPFLIDGIQQDGLEETHLQALHDILPYTDLVGLSIYPIKSRFGTYLTLASMFDDLFGKLRAVTDKPFAITETGYPATSFRVANLPFETDPQKQARFMRLLFREVEKNGNIEFVTNFAVRDLVDHMDNLRARSQETPPFISPGLVEFFQYFEHIGIYDVEGNARPATQIWIDTLALPLQMDDPWVKPVSITSPAGDVVTTLNVDNAGELHYTLTSNGITVLENSPLGITVDSIDLGSAVTNIIASAPIEFSETYPVRGTHTLATNHYNEVTLTVRRAGTGDVAYDIALRLYNDGLAYRYLVPGKGDRIITAEASGWTLPEGSIVWHQTETGNYEAEYRKAVVGMFDDNMGGPITIELPGDAGFVALTEAALFDYSGMTFDANVGSCLIRSEFLDDESWTVPGGSVTPWRLAIVSADLNGLVNSDMVPNVSPPPDPALFPDGLNTGWIRPGRAVWSWWSDFNSGFMFEVQRQYVDYAHTLGFECVLVDAWWELGFPQNGKDQFERLGELADYAHSDGRNVGIWVWKSWYELILHDARQEFFEAVKAAGAVGVKIDNVFAEDSESFMSVQIYEEILQEAAELQLMINFHGCNKSTGLSRTYPNEVTREGFMGLEINSLLWGSGWFVTPRHNAALPFIRFVAGPGDYTPVTFDPRKIGDTTFTHQLATAGLYTSPQVHYADNPEILLAQTDVLDVLKAIPTEWDETLVIRESVIGKLAGLARRAGDQWYLFVINGDASKSKTIDNLDLSFLCRRKYDAILIQDETQTSFKREKVFHIDGDYELDVTMLPGGGFVAMFTPMANQSRSFRLGFTSLPPIYTEPGYVVAYSMLRDHADVVAHSFQDGIPWPEALLSSDYRTYSQNLRANWELLRSANESVIPNHERYIMINPIATTYQGLAPYWGNHTHMPLPSPWDQYEFNDPNVKTALVNYIIAAVEFFQPTYLAVNVEANILLAKLPLEWKAYKELNEHVYTTIKGLYPDLTVFSTIQYEHMLGLHLDSANLAEQLSGSYPNILENEVRMLLQHSDLLALSTYPYLVSGNVVTDDYYDLAYSIAQDLNKPIAIDQTGYISQDFFYEPFNTVFPGSDELQNNFLKFLLREAHDHNFEFVVNFVAADYGSNYGTDPTILTWAYVGLLNEDGTAKPALATWDAFMQLTYDGENESEIKVVGNVRSTIVGEDSVDFVLDQGVAARVELLDSDVLRVRVNPEGTFTDRVSGAIAPTRLIPPDSSIFDTDLATYLTTEHLSVTVLKEPFQVIVLRPDGSLITADCEHAVGWDPESGFIFNSKRAREDETYFGLGLRGGPLNRRGDVFVMRNSDNSGYGEFTGPLYSSMPFYYGAREGAFYGLFLDNPAQPFFDMDSSTKGRLSFGAQQGELDYYVFAGPDPADVARSFARLTGFAPLPAKWTLGFHQSRHGYQSWDEILGHADTFRALEIPADAFYLDLDYMENLNLFTWDSLNFSDPIANNQALEDLGFRRVNIVDPAVRTDDPLWEFLAEFGFFLQDTDGNALVNSIFLGDVSWIDFTDPKLRQWFTDQLKVFLQTGISGVWNDLNEPAQNFMPEAIYDFGGQDRTDLEARNLYALQETSLTHRALLEVRPHERPFVLSRSGYPGIQRYAANWSGDTLSTFDSLRVSVQTSLHMSLSGQIQFGHDIGGFFDTPSPELFIRWLQFGSLTPFFRNHALNTTDPSEPWQFGEPYTSIAREAINQRYRLLPYLYTLFEKASRTGEPVLAPTFFHFPGDPQTYTQDQEFMLGASLLVAPVVEEGARTRTVYLPAGAKWFNLHTGLHTGQVYTGGKEVTVAAPLERIPIFVRQGAILATGPIMQYVDEPVPPRVDIHIYTGANGQFTLYEDDGISFDYEQGEYRRTCITSIHTSQSCAVTIEPVEGNWVPPQRPWWLYFHQVMTRPIGVSLNGIHLPNAATEGELDSISAGWFYRSSDQLLILRLQSSELPATVKVQL